MTSFVSSSSMEVVQIQEKPEPIAKRFHESVLTRIQAGHFRITISLGWQAVLWKILLQPHHQDPRLRPEQMERFYSATLITLWSLSLLLLLSLTYALKCAVRFHSVKAEFMHRIGVNYLFAPWISWLLILESAPFVTTVRKEAFVVLWWVLAVPVVVLDVKIYGQWFIKGRRFLTDVANPTSQMTVVGNLVGARAAAKMGWRETATFLFALGIVHYFVLFVTLYQRFAGGGGDRLPAILRPTFCLFFGAPSVASLAWYSISGSFDTGAKMLFFLSLFLFASLICRPWLFKKAMRRFNVAWWAYSYPITMLALTAVRYEQEVSGGLPFLIRMSLSALSIIVFFVLLLLSGLNPKLLLSAEGDDDRTVLPNTSRIHIDTARGAENPSPTNSTNTPDLR